MPDYKQIFYLMSLPALLLKRTNNDYIIKGANRSFSTGVGYNEEDLLGKDLFELFAENSHHCGMAWDGIFTSLGKVVSSGASNAIKNFRFNILNVDTGEFEERYWQILNTPVVLNGKVSLIQSLMIEKTSEVMSRRIKEDFELELVKLKERGEHFIEGNSDGLYSLDIKGNFLSVNKGLQIITDTPEADLLKMNFFPFCSSHHKEKVFHFFSKALNGTSQNFEADFVSSKGREMMLKISINPFTVEGEVAGVYGIAKDITEFRESENAFTRNENRYRAMIEEGFDLISILDSEGTFKFVGGAFLNLFGLSQKDFVGKNSFDLVHPEDKELAIKNFSKLSFKKQVQTLPYRFQDINGNWRWIETKGTNLLDDPDIEGIVLNSREVTELVKISDERDQILQRYKLAASATSDLIYDWDLDTDEVIRFSKENKSVFGYSTEEINERKFWSDHIHCEEIEGLKEILQKTLSDSEANLISTQYRLKQADGTYAHLIDRGNIVRDESGKAVRVVGATTDVSEVVRSKNDLKMANMRFEYAMKASQEMIWDYDIVNDHVLRGNSFHEIYGYDSKQDPTVVNFWFSKIFESEREEVVLSLQEAIENAEVKKWSREYSFRKENGKRAYVIDRGYIFRNEAGEAIRMVGAVLDVTESKELIGQIENQNQLLKEVAWEQSHIVRAPLARQKALLALLEEEIYDEWNQGELLQLIKEAADELDGLITSKIKKTEALETIHVHN
jgi:PAS domain S-box-containing protein